MLVVCWCGLCLVIVGVIGWFVCNYYVCVGGFIFVYILGVCCGFLLVCFVIVGFVGLWFCVVWCVVLWCFV